MRWIKILAIILGAGWFFPVSCTTSLFVGTNIIAKLDERQVSKGEQVHSLFTVVVEPGENGESFRVVDLSEWQGLTENGSFLMSKTSGSAEIGDSEITYQIMTSTDSEQVIEVVHSHHNGDSTSWSRYKASDFIVTPISSRIFHVGYMFAAIPYAFGFALTIYLIGRLFRQ